MVVGDGRAVVGEVRWCFDARVMMEGRGRLAFVFKPVLTLDVD
jgi:hypothetical protein